MKKLAAIVSTLLLCASAFAQQPYPSRAIRFIVPYAPGGGTDIVARVLAQRLTEGLRQTVTVDNRGGASGMVGTELAAKSPPDGYTIVMGTTGSFALNPSLYSNTPYDPVRDFSPVSLIAMAPHLLVVHPSLPVKTVKELIAYARAHPSRLTFSSGGGSSRLSGEMLMVMAKINMVHVPYRGVAPAAVATVIGEVSLAFSDVMVLLPHVKSGKLRGLASTGSKRSPAAPDLPTVAEAGLPGYESGVWYGVLVPAATPREIIARLHGEIVKAVQHPELRDRLIAEGSTVVGNSPEEFGTYLRSEMERWAKVIKAANIKGE